MSKEKNQKNEINELLQLWAKNNLPEDEEERETLLNWGRLCNREIHNQLNIMIQDDYGAIAIYTTIFQAILDQLKEERATKSACEIIIADVVSIGYDDSEDENEEKIGNFTPFIYDIGNKKFEITRSEISTLDDVSADTPKENLETMQRCVAWTNKHIEKQKKTLNEIAKNALKNISEQLDYNLVSPAVIYPLFIICHTQLREYIKLLRVDRNESSTSMDICGNFTVYASLVGDGTEVSVQYKPDPSHKLQTKSDAKASSIHEDEE